MKVVIIEVFGIVLVLFVVKELGVLMIFVRKVKSLMMDEELLMVFVYFFMK